MKRALTAHGMTVTRTELIAILVSPGVTRALDRRDMGTCSPEELADAIMAAAAARGWVRDG
jgi:hypothetical protein